MREIEASEAKTNLDQILDDVKHGETILITRHGRPIARLVPEGEVSQTEISDAIDGLKALRRGIGRDPLSELLSARHEGHKY